MAELWIGVIVCLIIEAISISVVHYKELPASKPHRLSKSISFGIFSTYQIYCSQSITTNIIHTPERSIFFSSLIIDLIITSAYGAGLAAILTLPSFSDIADTLVKMVSFQLEWGAVSDAWTFSVLNSEDVIFHHGVYIFLKIFLISDNDQQYFETL